MELGVILLGRFNFKGFFCNGFKLCGKKWNTYGRMQDGRQLSRIGITFIIICVWGVWVLVCAFICFYCPLPSIAWEVYGGANTMESRVAGDALIHFSETIHPDSAHSPVHKESISQTPSQVDVARENTKMHISYSSGIAIVNEPCSSQKWKQREGDAACNKQPVPSLS